MSGRPIGLVDTGPPGQYERKKGDCQPTAAASRQKSKLSLSRAVRVRYPEQTRCLLYEGNRIKTEGTILSERIRGPASSMGIDTLGFAEAGGVR